jgi:hypothetical protein
VKVAAVFDAEQHIRMDAKVESSVFLTLNTFFVGAENLKSYLKEYKRKSKDCQGKQYCKV